MAVICCCFRRLCKFVTICSSFFKLRYGPVDIKHVTRPRVYKQIQRHDFTSNQDITNVTVRMYIHVHDKWTHPVVVDFSVTWLVEWWFGCVC
jgi:hypothetical protein